jgi:uncharacterized LabA/DUF88 family protein
MKRIQADLFGNRPSEQLKRRVMPGLKKIELWPAKSNHWPAIIRTDFDPALYSSCARADQPVMIASRPRRFINLDDRLQTMSSDSKIALFIDGANLHATARALGFDIDYKRLLKEFQSRGVLLRAYYYTAVVEDQEYTSIRPLIDWLDYNGYTVVTKMTKEFIDASGRRKVKGNMDIELAVDAMELAGHVDQIVLFSGDGDFRSLVEAVQRRGVRVTVVSTLSSQPPMIADELRRQADVFTDLVELQSRLGRDPSERPAPRNGSERSALGPDRVRPSQQ